MRGCLFLLYKIFEREVVKDETDNLHSDRTDRSSSN